MANLTCDELSRCTRTARLYSWPRWYTMVHWTALAQHCCPMRNLLAVRAAGQQAGNVTLLRGHRCAHLCL